MKTILAVFTLVFLLVGCASTPTYDQLITHTKLYNLNTGEAIELEFQNIDALSAKVIKSSTTKNGETFTGETHTVRDESITKTSGNSSWLGYNGKSTTTGSASASGNATTSSGTRRGTGILVGNKGTVINLKYDIANNNAIGEAVDNNGVKYSLQCCRVEIRKN